jgi:hypothetical protein
METGCFNTHKISSLLLFCLSMDEFFQGKVTQLNKYKFMDCILSAINAIEVNYNKIF